ncbi:MAG: hypothetical protein JNN12_03030 [Bacteroidetes Order II. Incertae sedis bacterium]|nr:hypothetical protein [Bacteroidetes Order II. bacterium]
MWIDQMPVGKTKVLPKVRFRKRWGIEAFFQSIKKRDMDVASSRLSLDWFCTLLDVVFVAAALLMHVGHWLHPHHKAIRLKPHKDRNDKIINTSKRKSFLRHGFDMLQSAVQRPKANKLPQ